MSLMAITVLAGIQPILSVAFVAFLILTAVVTQIATSSTSNTGNSISFPLSKGYVKRGIYCEKLTES
jgi:hypothetical protein